MILTFKQNWESVKVPSIIYVDFESLIKELNGCKNNPEKLSTTKATEQITFSFSISAISSFKRIKNNHDAYRGEDCRRKFCKPL